MSKKRFWKLEKFNRYAKYTSLLNNGYIEIVHYYSDNSVSYRIDVSSTKSKKGIDLVVDDFKSVQGAKRSAIAMAKKLGLL